ncbi:MAG: cupin domain-containing protein [Hyphomonas sp.]|uniref:cupin domain-containing protein n=1 Tax=Hyphomonas sp. TaxID=87 RepID=UPI003529BD12
MDGTRFSELYSAYAAGRLDPAFALMVETQGALRGDVRRSVAASEMIAGALLEHESRAPLSAGALDRAFAAIDALAEDDIRVPAGDAEISALPEPLRALALEAAGQGGWKLATPGIRRLPLMSGGDLEMELYRIEPGARVPRHTHSGAEYTLVVSGGFSDEAGGYGPGDMIVKGPDDVHQPVGDADGVCFALAIRDGGLKFTGMMGVVQRLLGG